MRRRIVILGTFGNIPFAGMAWMNCQFLVGLARLGHDVLYAEATSEWPYDASQQRCTNDPGYTLAYLQKTLDAFGLGDRWIYRATYADGAWYGPRASDAVALLRSADAVFNIAGATIVEDIGVDCRLVHIGTDPVVQELRAAKGDASLRAQLDRHLAYFTYGENIGTPYCSVPPFASPIHPMRQPVLMDQWASGPPARRDFTTITNWRTTHHDVEYQGELYRWDKSHEFLKFLDAPRRSKAQMELAIGGGIPETDLELLRSHDWKVIDAIPLSGDPWTYRDYIRSSGAEFTVAKDMNVRLRSGWFSERSACYLAAGRPVVTQDTGFGRVLPVGEGLFAFQTLDEILAALEAIRSDYERHSKAARAIAEEYFKAETVLAKVLDGLGF